MTSTDKDLSLTPLKGNSGKAYMGTYPNGDRVFVKMNTTFGNGVDGLWS